MVQVLSQFKMFNSNNSCNFNSQAFSFTGQCKQAPSIFGMSMSSNSNNMMNPAMMGFMLGGMTAMQGMQGQGQCNNMMSGDPMWGNNNPMGQMGQMGQMGSMMNFMGSFMGGLMGSLMGQNQQQQQMPQNINLFHLG